MRRITILGLGLLGLLGLTGLAGCSEETPTSVASDLLGEGFRTFEVVVDAADFLQGDTTYDRLGSLNAAPFTLVAEAFEGELYAHTLFRVSIPGQVTYEDEEGATFTDTTYTVVGGTVTLVLDSLRADHETVEFEVLDVVESWDPGSVTWDTRVDTADVTEPWTEPGGTTGQVLGTGEWTSGDTVRITLTDAAEVLTEEGAGERGALVRAKTDGVRLRIQSMTFELDVIPERSDSVYPIGTIGRRVAIVTPEPSTPPATELRVGGVPIWRSALHFRPLRDLEVPCSPGSTTCTVPLRDVAINQASLLLQPRPVTERRIERPFRIEARAVLRGEGVPISRSPLSNAFGDMADAMAEELFETDADAGRVAVPVTPFLRRNINPSDGEDPLLWLALVARAEQEAPLFGYAAFGSTATAEAPQLRIVVTVPVEEESQ